MPLGVETEADQIQSITDDIKEKFPECMEHTMVSMSGASGTFTPDTILFFGNSGNEATIVEVDENLTWVFVKDITPNSVPISVDDPITGTGVGTVTKAESIEDVIDNCILLKVFNIVALSLGKLREMFQDMFKGLKTYSAPCGADKLLEGSDVGDAQQAHMKLVNKLQSGAIFDEAHTKLQEAYMTNIDDCIGLYNKLSEICGSLDGLTDLINQILNALKAFEELLDKMMSILGLISAILGCGEELLDTFGAEAPWVGELNSDISTTMDAVKEAKQATSSPAATIQYAKEKAATDMGFDVDVIDRKNEMLNLGELF